MSKDALMSPKKFSKQYYDLLDNAIKNLVDLFDINFVDLKDILEKLQQKEKVLSLK